MMIDQKFSPAEAEDRIYDAWEKSGAFAAGANAKDGAESFCIVIPPPNVTGSLHIGRSERCERRGPRSPRAYG